MNAHINSKMLLRRIAGKKQPKGKEKIGFYDVKNQKYGSMKIDSQEFVKENLHDKINASNQQTSIKLEDERAKLEDKFAKILDKLIDLKINEQVILNEDAYDLFLKFYIFQSFTTTDNFANNKILIQKNKVVTSSDLEQNVYSEDQGIELVNCKLIALIKNHGPYFDKVQILKEHFTPIILNLTKNKAFYTDKLFRIFWYKEEVELMIESFIPKESKLEKENMGFSLTSIQIGSIDNNNLLVFINNIFLNCWDITDKDSKLKKIQNEKLENSLFNLTGDFSLLNKFPNRYLCFNNEDLDWIKDYFSKTDYLNWCHKKFLLKNKV